MLTSINTLFYASYLTAMFFNRDILLFLVLFKCDDFRAIHIKNIFVILEFSIYIFELFIMCINSFVLFLIWLPCFVDCFYDNCNSC